MAGAGYRLFNTGDVLTAAQVNTFLMEQTVMVFADAAARTTALTGVVSEGMISYLRSTKQVEVYNGTAWVASDDPNAIQNTIVDAKGDLIAATANDTPARLAVGSNGDTLVADSAATTGLRWQGNYAAGKNKILNGAMDIWQRGSSANNAGVVYGADQWRSFSYSGSSSTISRQTFTPGTAPTSGYEAQYFLRCTSTNTQTLLWQNIEDVRTFAGQTVTLSFWVKVATNVTIGATAVQNFGSGGSADVSTTFNPGVGLGTATSSWQRFSATISVPSISGKTVGTGSYLQINIFHTGINNAMDIWGVQLEAGSVATAFQTATGTLQGETALCQRYYFRSTGANVYTYHGLGTAVNSTTCIINVSPKVTMRTTPSGTIEFANLAISDAVATTSAVTSIGWNSTENPNNAVLSVTSSGLTANRAYWLINNNNAAGYVGFSAEL